MFSHRLPLVMLALALCLLAGCGAAKLNETKTLKFDDNLPVQALDLTPQPAAQKITVEFSANNDVSVYLFKEEDARGDNMAYASPAKALGSKKDSKGDTFSVDVPPNTATRVVVRSGGRKAEVKLTVTNQK